jgi:hypothetical protein
LSSRNHLREKRAGVRRNVGEIGRLADVAIVEARDTIPLEGRPLAQRRRSGVTELVHKINAKRPIWDRSCDQVQHPATMTPGSRAIRFVDVGSVPGVPLRLNRTAGRTRSMIRALGSAGVFGSITCRAHQGIEKTARGPSTPVLVDRAPLSMRAIETAPVEGHAVQDDVGSCLRFHLHRVDLDILIGRKAAALWLAGSTKGEPFSGAKSSTQNSALTASGGP